LTLLAGPLSGQGAPGFQPGEYLEANGQLILQENLDTATTMCDWNGDGAKDLLVGTFFHGSVYVFLNVGTDAAPVFAGGTLLEADGSPIGVFYS